MAPPPQRGETHSSVLILKQQPPSFACSHLPLHPSFPPSLFTLTLNLPVASLLVSSHLTTPTSFSIHFHLQLLIHLRFFVCLFDCSALVRCLLLFSQVLQPDISSHSLISNRCSIKHSSLAPSPPFDHIFMSLFMSHKNQRRIPDPALVTSKISFIFSFFIFLVLSLQQLDKISNCSACTNNISFLKKIIEQTKPVFMKNT